MSSSGAWMLSNDPFLSSEESTWKRRPSPFYVVEDEVDSDDGDHCGHGDYGDHGDYGSRVLCASLSYDNERVSVSVSDYERLAPGVFLNDTLLQFYINWIQMRVLTPLECRQAHFFSSFFYNKLTAAKTGESVRTWTKGVDIFQKDFLVVPINTNAHWLLAIVCLHGCRGRDQDATTTEPSASTLCSKNDPDPCVATLCPVGVWFDRRLTGIFHSFRSCIFIFDSMRSFDSSRYAAIAETLRRYLAQEHASKKHAFGFQTREFSSRTLPCFCPEVPQQDNFYDCGIYVLQYIESFFEHPFSGLSHPCASLHNWFEKGEVDGKRRKIAGLIQKLARDQNPETVLKFPRIDFRDTERSAETSGCEEIWSTTKKSKTEPTVFEV